MIYRDVLDMFDGCDDEWSDNTRMIYLAMFIQSQNLSEAFTDFIHVVKEEEEIQNKG